MNKACSFHDIILQEVTTLQEMNSLNIMDLVFCDIYAFSCFFSFSLKHSILFNAITEICMILSKRQNKYHQIHTETNAFMINHQQRVCFNEATENQKMFY